MNITLMDKARSMHNSVGLTQEFWAEAVDIEKYILNMSPSSMIFETNPNELWLGKNPLVSHNKVFGCDGFIHVPNEKRSKLNKKEIKCIFIGYKEGMKGYKLWDPTSRKKAYSRNVVFREVGSKTDPKENFQTENNLETVWFELRNEEDDSGESIELEEEMEQPTLVVRR
jgi:hypothetical protein